jgi:hypothetical protein
VACCLLSRAPWRSIAGMPSEPIKRTISSRLRATRRLPSSASR